MPTPEQIDKWTKEGHWPPPTGVIFAEQKIPINPERVKNLARLLQQILPPPQGEVIKRIFNL